MNNADQLKRWFWTLAALTFIFILCPGPLRAESRTGKIEITPENMEYSEPFEVTAKIMDIDYGEKMLVVAEKKIYVVDLMIGTESVRSILSDVNGRPISFDSLHRGNRVTVKGVLLSDGRVIAEKLVRMN